MSLKPLFILLIFTLASCSAPSDPSGSKEIAGARDYSALRQQLSAIVQPYHANVGIAVMNLENYDTITLNNDRFYLLQSVYKLPLAMAVIKLADDGRINLSQEIRLRKEDLANEFGAIYQLYPNGNVDLSITELLTFSIGQSDNNARQLLIKLVNGENGLEKYVEGLNIAGFGIDTGQSPAGQAGLKWATPYATAQLLDAIYHKKHLSDTGNALLLKLMTEGTSGPNRIKGLLPQNTLVAHKTGTSGANENGVMPATNDVGIITLPNGNHIALVVFVADSEESLETNEKIIATIAKAVYDFFAAE